MTLATLVVVGCLVRVEWDDARLSPFVAAAFGGFARSPTRDSVALSYRLISEPGQTWYSVSRNGGLIAQGLDISQLLFAVQQDIVVSVQSLRHDLVFVHAAVLQRDGFAFVLAAPSGSGKSTLCWAMLHEGEGFRLMSDELAPIDPKSLDVLPFLLAVTLKSRPPECCPLPASTLETSRALYIPVAALPSTPAVECSLLRAMVFVDYKPGNTGPSLTKLSVAEAASRLYPNVLNALAHESMGIDVSIRFARSVPSYFLASADVAETAKKVSRLLCSLSRTPF
ncbi:MULTISPECIES: hypothetical protein [unclassified Thiocapsa]|uniref:hypothetical protein n=1 Tax=unclassified Thiocapsa TaxID=2641286 RepID=UPI0035B0C362